MKKFLSLLAALMLVSLSVYAGDDNCNGNGGEQGELDNCFDEATGVFCISVEEAIDVTGPINEICLGDICPGCTYVIPEDECMIFIVEGGEDCWIHVVFNGEENPDPDGEMYESEESAEVYLMGLWQYWDDNLAETWENFDPTSEHWTSNIWPLDTPNNNDDPNEVQFRLCGTIYATCDAEAGDYTIEIGLTANYVCGVI